MNNLKIQYINTDLLLPSAYNPRKWNQAQIDSLTESVKRFGLVDPIICNGAPDRLNTVIGGHFRLKIAKDLNIETVPVVYINIPDIEKEKELNLRLNKNQGEFDLELLKDFEEEFLLDVGFNSEELDEIFEIESNPEIFDLKKELDKLKINEVKVKPGDKYEIDGSVLMCGDSTKEEDMLELMNGVQTDMVMTDPPYILDYLRGGTKGGKATEGFGVKKNRKYLGTDSLPDNFTELWMNSVSKVQKPDFSIMIFEHPKKSQNNMERIRKTLEVQEYNYLACTKQNARIFCEE
jgi:hypothetical protein